MAARMAMMAITTNSSISVKAQRRDFLREYNGKTGVDLFIIVLPFCVLLTKNSAFVHIIAQRIFFCKCKHTKIIQKRSRAIFARLEGEGKNLFGVTDIRHVVGIIGPGGPQIEGVTVGVIGHVVPVIGFVL